MNAERAHDYMQTEPAPNVRAALQLWAEIDRARNDRNVALIGRLAGTLELLLEGLPTAEREEYQRRLNVIRDGVSPRNNRGGEVYGNIIELFQKSGQREWTALKIQDALNKIGKEAEIKAIYNTINYFARTGRLQRIARGVYLLKEIGGLIHLEGVPDDGTTRMTEHED